MDDDDYRGSVASVLGRIEIEYVMNHDGTTAVGTVFPDDLPLVIVLGMLEFARDSAFTTFAEEEGD